MTLALDILMILPPLISGPIHLDPMRYSLDTESVGPKPAGR